MKKCDDENDKVRPKSVPAHGEILNQPFWGSKKGIFSNCKEDFGNQSKRKPF